MVSRAIRALLLLAVVGAAFGQTYHGVKVVRKDTEPEFLNPNGADPECTSIYEVTLSADMNNQCNDLSMLPPHGADLTGCELGNANDWRNWPYPNSAEKQNIAKAKFSVTALTESSGRGYTTPFNQPNKATQDAYPLGFNSATIKEYHSVCVTVKNVGQRWVEIMAQSVQQDKSMCVTDWKKPDLNENPVQEACGSGEIYSCRPANNLEGQTDINLRFYCKDSCEGTDLPFYFRISASYVGGQGTNNGDGDGEDWCQFRKGDDFPLSLLAPYPEVYNAPNVFFGSTSGSAHVHPAFPFLLLLAALALVLVFAY
jgi:hypothetical protein